jgi:hypothetical protein
MDEAIQKEIPGFPIVAHDMIFQVGHTARELTSRRPG